MKNKVTTIVAAVGLFLALAVSISAQTPTGAEVNIPFDFSAGKAHLKAGTYVITRSTGNALQIRSTDGKKTVLVNAPLTLGSRDFKAGERLVFNRYGSEYFLTQVWLTVDTGRQLFPSKVETAAARQLANNNTKAGRVEIAIKNR
ncbi:MAG TPA: hypothetical protein VF074_19880 [Pyrinomonadaceae bacterium]